MWPKIRVALYVIPAISLILLAGLTLSGVDSAGDLPGILRLIVLTLSVAAWSLLFSGAMVAYAIKKRYYRLLAVAGTVLVARVIFFSELYWGNAEDYYYLWLPVEYLAFYFTLYQDSLAAKCKFAVANGGLYCLNLMVAGNVLSIL